MYEALALAPVAVLPRFQKQGIGSDLIRVGLAKAKEAGYGAVIVLGHPTYYPRFGFEPASRWGLTCPFDVPEKAFMAMELDAGYLDGKAGRVIYPDAFGD